MRIEGHPGEPLPRAYLWLTPAEARELEDALEDLLAGVDSSWHAHVAAADYQTELTVALDHD